MLVAKFTMNPDKKSVTLRVKGHAGQNKYGQDIVCSAASILAYTLAQNVHIEEQRGVIKGNPKINMKDGDATITCKCKTDEQYAEICHTYVVIQAGYQLLAHNYPQYVAVEKFGDNEG